ncbi:Tfp pilus assembly protein FimT/FimU [Polynucleobacter sp. MWH-UH25E]|uniref:pilus assembly FimT family protein n=1 Tax=Polynucleobacter sp. MWH-UH25E TaxID=1855616 RepID=UPI001BFD5255|nr:type II secretion system protein [Polynucleobacter sp. MWH-UH25E]QWD61794.1 type II secretion system protein [Polynucleobacter sp. MWH-UH25E]
MKQKGVSFLEVIVVVGILLIVSSFITPSIMNWRAKRALESDYMALLSTVDFIKTRVRTINGTGVLICSSPTKLTYQISSNPQSLASSVASGFSNNLLEDPSATDINFNVLSGESTIVSTLCSTGRGVFASSGLTSTEGGGAIDIELNRGGDRTKVGAFRVLVNQTTGFVQKYRWKENGSAWVEQD